MKKSLISFCLGLLPAGALVFSQDILRQQEAQQVYRILSDGFFLSAVLFIGLGLMIWMAGEGQFLSLRFVGHRVFTMFRWGYPRPKPLSYLEFRKAHMPRRTPFVHLIGGGAAHLLLAILFYVLFHQNA